MNALQIIHVSCIGIYLWISGYVLWRAPRLQRSAGVAGIAVCFACWSATLFIAHDPGATRAQAKLAYDLGAVAWASFSSLSLAFALAFAGRREALARASVRAALVIPPLVVMTAQWRGALAADYVHESWGWAFVWSGSGWTIAFYAYYALYTAAAVGIVFVTGRRASDPLIRRQATIIVTTGMVPFIGSTSTDVILPWLGHHELPNIAPMFLVVWTTGIAVAIVRYRLLDTESAADDILRAMSDGLVLVGRDGRVVAGNLAANQMLAGGADLRGAELSDVLAKATGKIALDATEIEVASNTLAVSSAVVHAPEGDSIGTIRIFRDISERKRAEQANRELQRAVRALGALQATVDAIHKVNSAPELGAAVVRTLARNELADGCRVTLDGETHISEGLTPVPAPIRVEVVASGKARGWIEAHIAGREVREVERDAIARVASEISQALEGLALRHAVAQADRLASVGVLAAGVAHEINNPLTYLVLGLHEIRDELEVIGDAKAAPLRERADEALHGCERIEKIVRELGSFARDGDELRVLPVTEAIDGAIAMATHQIRHRARLVVELAATGTVRADLGRLTQVVLNLLVNAARAIPDGNIEAHRITIASRDEASEVVITVSDTGRGIAADDLPHVFEPFFTTGASGEGSGLGLSISLKIVRALGGKIAVECPPGEGARFEVRLPRVTATPVVPPAPVVARASAGAAPAPGTILIVDDDAPVARALERLLEGHRVTVVSSGAEARRRFEAGERYELVLCDVMMPDLNGPELHAWVVAHRPELAPRMVFMTGGAFTPETAAFFERHRADLLAKPFTPETVERIVADMLQRARAS